MRIFKITNNLDAVCDWQKTRNGFKHVASLCRNGNEIHSAKCCYLNRTWESYEYESVLRALFGTSSQDLSKYEKTQFNKCIKNGGQRAMRELKSIGALAALGNILCSDIKEKNDWKERMIKAGLQDKGLIMPDDWDTLTEEEKETRLNLVVNELSKVQ